MITATHVKKAAKTANYGNVQKAKMAAIAISESGEIIASAHNRRVWGEKTRFSDHAEEVLLQKLIKLKAFQRYGKIRILVLRITKKGFGLAKPCKRCQRQLAKYNVEIYYTTNDLDGLFMNVLGKLEMEEN